jgi:hypothetical protein
VDSCLPYYALKEQPFSARLPLPPDSTPAQWPVLAFRRRDTATISVVRTNSHIERGALDGDLRPVVETVVIHSGSARRSD